MAELQDERPSWAQRIGLHTMEFTDELRAAFGEDIVVGTICIVADVIAGEGADTTNPIVFSVDDPRRWVQVALLREALDQAELLNEDREANAELA